mmetsp:Transcript_122080/g.345255  ORF Transcript_122080/g.345255 Transcript_122080/m.345255 type:complete len:257 (-) Transcript_122080:458-1228(-)
MLHGDRADLDVAFVRRLGEELLVHAVAVLRGEEVDAPHNLDHVQATVNCATWQAPVEQGEAIALARDGAHPNVRLFVLWRQGAKVIEGLAQATLDLVPEVDDEARRQAERRHGKQFAYLGHHVLRRRVDRAIHGGVRVEPDVLLHRARQGLRDTQAKGAPQLLQVRASERCFRQHELGKGGREDAAKQWQRFSAFLFPASVGDEFWKKVPHPIAPGRVAQPRELLWPAAHDPHLPPTPRAGRASTGGQDPDVEVPI